MTSKILQQTETPAQQWDRLWTEYMACVRAGHAAKAAELKLELGRFDRDVLGVRS